MLRTMHFDLSTDDAKRLLLLVSLGEAVLNDWTPESQQGPEQRAACDFLQDLCERMAGTDVDDLITRDAETGVCLPSPLLEEHTEAILRLYDESMFWEELAVRLAQSDIRSEYGEDGMQRMPAAYRAAIEGSMTAHYRRELQQRGIDRLVVLNASAAGTTVSERAEQHDRQ